MVRDMKAYVMITTKSGTAEKLTETIRKVKSVISAECVFGRFDVIAIVESPEMKTISRVVHQIQRHPEVLHTETAFTHYPEDHESEIVE